LKKYKLQKIWKQLGPGLITGSSDDDPSGITTYSQAGAKFGLDTLWTALFTWPLMTAIQHMCAKIGLVTKQGLAGTVKKEFPSWVIWFVLLISIPAILLNIGANISAMSGVICLLVPGIHPMVWGLCISGFIYWFMIQFSYRKFSGMLKYICLILLVYAIIPFLIRVDLSKVMLATFVPKITLNSEYAEMLIAIFGTTLSPYLFFWQSNMDAEETSSLKNVKKGMRTLFINEKTDIIIGMGFSNLIMFFIILTTGTVLHASGKMEINTLEDAALALKPLAGKNAFVLFSSGILGTGLLSIPVLSATIAYMVCETMGWKMGMNHTYHEAKTFYNLIGLSLAIGILFQILKINPIKSLAYSAFGYGLVAPVIIVIILMITNNKRIMGNQTNNLITNILGWISVVLMASSVLFYFYR